MLWKKVGLLTNQHVVLLSMTLMLSSCSSEYAKVRKELKLFERSAIELPSDMLIISEGKVQPYQGSTLTDNTFFIYYPSVDCSDCLASKLSALVPLYSLMKESGFKMKCIISPADGSSDELVSKLSSINSPYDLYVDVSDSFSNLNQSLPTDSRFHLFCTDSSGKPFFVGNPCSDAKSYKLFVKLVKRL